MFGNRVLQIGVHHAHDGARAAGRERGRRRAGRARRSPGEPWEVAAWRVQELRGADALAVRPFAGSSQYVPLGEHGPALRAIAEEAFTAAPPDRRRRPRTLCHVIHETFEYDPTFTDVSTPLSAVLDGRRGVCQDFAHLATGCLRSLGLAARYVSGYIETDPPPGRAPRRRRRVARVVLGVGAPAGLDRLRPDERPPPADRHVTLAWGRDYGDVAPVRGVVIGPAVDQSLSVEVEVQRSGSAEGLRRDAPRPVGVTRCEIGRTCLAPGIWMAASNMSGVRGPPRLEAVHRGHGGGAGVLHRTSGCSCRSCPTFSTRELGAGEIGVGLCLAAFALAAIRARPSTGGSSLATAGATMMIGSRARRRSLGPVLDGPHAVDAAAAAWRRRVARGRPVRRRRHARRRPVSRRHRRAEAASYFSVAVFFGLGIGPILGDAVLGGGEADGRAFLIAGRFAWLAASLSLLVPEAVRRRCHDLSQGRAGAVAERRGLEVSRHASGRAAVGPGLVLACGIAGFVVFTVFLPQWVEGDRLRRLGRPVRVDSVVCLRRCGSPAPSWLVAPRRAQGGRMSCSSSLFLARRTAAFPDAWALWMAAACRVRVGVPVPVVDGVDREPGDEREPAAGDQLVHDVLPGRQHHRGVVFGLIAQCSPACGRCSGRRSCCAARGRGSRGSGWCRRRAARHRGPVRVAGDVPVAVVVD